MPILATFYLFLSKIEMIFWSYSTTKQKGIAIPKIVQFWSLSRILAQGYICSQEVGTYTTYCNKKYLSKLS